MPRWTLTVAVSLAIAAVSFGCRRHVDPVHDARRVQGFERNLIRIAARDSRCAPVQVQPTRIWASCRWRRIPPVAQSAQSTLMCPPEAIQQQATPQPLVRTAAGCGRSVQMTMTCNQVGCGWVASSQPTGAPAPTGQPNTIVYVPAE